MNLHKTRESTNTAWVDQAGGTTLGCDFKTSTRTLESDAWYLKYYSFSLSWYIYRNAI